MRLARQVSRYAYVIVAVALLGGGFGIWRAEHPSGWHPGFGGDRISISVNGGCPSPLPTFSTVANRDGGSPSLLVPRGPTAALICRYGPGRTGAESLYRQVRVGPVLAARIASGADAIHSSAPSGSISCPDQIASVTLLAFRYSNGTQAALEWSDSGCQSLNNGNLAGFQMNAGFSTFQSAVDPVAPPQAGQEG